MSKRKTTKEFIKESKLIFGDDSFNYDKTVYLSNKKKVILTCPIHGDFYVRPDNHLFRRNGCPYCSEKHQWTTDEYISLANKAHGNTYDYHKTNYKNSKTKIIITCKKHGDYTKYPIDHLNGQGCQECVKEKLRNLYLHNTETFIENAKKIHGNRYLYDNSKYVDSHSQISIICRKHGEFFQTPNYHLSGCGCPKCNFSKLEEEIDILLSDNSINYVNRYSPEWLGLQHLDFYLPDLKIAIECQGLQHYIPVQLFGGEEEYAKTVERDEKKAKLCKENGVKLLYFTHYKNISEENNVYKTKDNILKEILSN